MEPIPAGPWPPMTMRSFSVAKASSATPEESNGKFRNYNPFSPSWNRVLAIMFPPTDPIFDVEPQHFSLSEGTQDWTTFFYISMNGEPVFMVGIRLPAEFDLVSKRQEVDGQMRKRLQDVATKSPMPVFYGISTYGTKMVFYRYLKNTNVIELEKDTPGLNISKDSGPRHWDILEEEGADKFKHTIEKVKQMCKDIF